MSNYKLQDHDFVLNSDKKYSLRVKELETKDRPREKMMERGPEELSVSELLSIVLSVGTKKEEVSVMSSRLLKEYGEKTLINQRDPKIISKELDIPIVKACQIVACFELGRRFYEKKSNGSVVVKSAKQAFEYLKDMRALPKEHFRGLYLNSQYKIVHDEVISIGSLTSSIVHPREVFKPALEYSAVAIIVAHNHPSGALKITEADLEVTQKLAEAGQILGIDLLDHLIIAKNKFVSIPFKI